MEEIQHLLQRVLHEVTESRIETREEIAKLRGEMNEQFVQVDKRFEQADKRFDVFQKYVIRKFDELEEWKQFVVQRLELHDKCFDLLMEAFLERKPNPQVKSSSLVVFPGIKDPTL